MRTHGLTNPNTIEYADQSAAHRRMVRSSEAGDDEFFDGAYATMLASEAILHKEWDTPEEDVAWADL